MLRIEGEGLLDGAIPELQRERVASEKALAGSAKADRATKLVVRGACIVGFCCEASRSVMRDETEREAFGQRGMKAADRVVALFVQERANLLGKETECAAARVEMLCQILGKRTLTFGKEKLLGKALAENHVRPSRLLRGISSGRLVNKP
ncbi:MAG TPA: hypothetical protein VKV32_03570 [Stellaceae bacterium]|nr:hypothetical protein [Stellaceae bacterium]